MQARIHCPVILVNISFLWLYADTLLAICIDCPHAVLTECSVPIIGVLMLTFFIAMEQIHLDVNLGHRCNLSFLARLREWTAI